MELGKTVSAATVEQGVARLAVSPSRPRGDAPAEAAMLDVESVFVTVGRVPNTEGLGLAEAGIAVTPRGWIEVDNCLQTSVPGVFAIGDVLGPEKIMLAPVSYTHLLEDCNGKQVIFSTTPIFDADQRLFRCVLSAQDMTEVTRLQEEAENSRRKLAAFQEASLKGTRRCV